MVGMGMMMNRVIGWSALLAMTTPTPLAAQVAGAPAPAPADASASMPASSPGYVLGDGDVVEVTVLASADYKARVAVEPDGTVVLPLIGRVVARGQSLTALRDTVSKRLTAGGYFVRPEVSVLLVTASSRFATVLGEVSTPGIIPLDRSYRLSEIVARAGGIKGVGADTVTLTTADGQSRDYQLSALATAAGSADPVVGAGDKVFVAPAKTFYIYGQVNQPGTYPIDADLTIRRALARGGGLTALGSEGKVKLFRGDTQVKKVSLDQKVEPGDTIVVGERFF